MPLSALKAALQLSWALQCHSCHGLESTSMGTFLQAYRAGCRAGMWMESRRQLGVPCPPPHHAVESTRVVADVGWDTQALLLSKSPFAHPSSPVGVSDSNPLNRGREPGFHPCSEHCLTCSCILPPGICAVCKVAPEAVGVRERLSSSVYEVLISPRVNSRTRDLRVLQCCCVCTDKHTLCPSFSG